MKKTAILMAVMPAIFAASCTSFENGPAQSGGSLKISIIPAVQTKADVTALDYESAINDMQVLLFDAGGDLYKCAVLEAPYTDVTLNDVKAGMYTVYALANYGASLAGAATLEEFLATGIGLDKCSTDPAKGFIMCGSKSGVAVEKGATSNVSFNIMRYVSRIKLKSVASALPAAFGPLVVKNVLLVNGYGQWTIDADQAPTGECNPAGRTGDGSGAVISSAQAAHFPDLTFKAVSDGSIQAGSSRNYNHCFYSFPNLNESDVILPSGKGGKARLVVTAEVRSKTYYYPVTLSDGMERNKSYDISLTIAGAGSEDPNVPLEKGALNISVSVSSWASGADYTERI